MNDGTQIDDGRRLFTWSWDQGSRPPYHKLADEIVASGVKLNRSGFAGGSNS